MLSACFRGQPPPNVDWDALIPLANESLTTAALAVRISGLSRLVVAEDISTFLAEILRRNIKRNEMLIAQLDEAGKALNSAAIVPVLQKGAAMLLASPESRKGRMISDLDLIVRRSDLAAAVHVLGQIGYQAAQPGACDDQPVILGRSRDAAAIDLHCRPRGPVDFSGDPILDRHSSLVVLGERGGRAVLPSPTLQTLYLILHDQFHDGDYWRGYIDLRHMLDIAQLAALPEGIDWDMLKAILATRYARHALAAQAISANRLMGVPIPADLAQAVLPRLQYRRRLMQADHPRLAPLFALLTILTELPPRKHEREEGRSFEKRVRRTRLHAQGLMRAKAYGKV